MTIPYNAWLHWILPDHCNLSCSYCYSDLSRCDSLTMPKIDIPALIKTLENAKRIFRINFAGGGEPFLVPNLVEACVELTKKHYISFNTNLTSPRVKELVNKVGSERVSYILASCHIKEMERMNLTDRFIENFLYCQEQGINITAMEVAYPPLFSEVELYKKFFKEKGIDLKFSLYIGSYNGKRYPKAYTKEELEKFGLSEESKSNCQFTKFCNAGFNYGYIDRSGTIFVCDQLRTNIGHIYKSINFNSKMIKCPIKFCWCPIKEFDYELHQKAIEESKDIKLILRRFLHRCIKRK